VPNGEVTIDAESSAVLRGLLNDAGGDQVHRLLRDAAKVVSSRLTLVETRRVVRRAVGANLLDELGATAVLETHARTRAGWALLEMSSEVADRAEEPFPCEPSGPSTRSI
jgi:uncharacterized protein (UPF0147 family)